MTSKVSMHQQHQIGIHKTSLYFITMTVHSSTIYNECNSNHHSMGDKILQFGMQQFISKSHVTEVMSKENHNKKVAGHTSNMKIVRS
uniref:Uncharacterized protein n=1 Tax=Arion vulgaris TaxID=1028688 RepID=A0A0B6Y9Q0_9EUPU